MKQKILARKVIALLFASCFMPALSYAATIVWNPATTYHIPNDGNIYTFASTITLTEDLLISGTLINNGVINNTLAPGADVGSGTPIGGGNGTVTGSGDFPPGGGDTGAPFTLTNNGLITNNGTITNGNGTRMNIFINNGAFFVNGFFNNLSNACTNNGGIIAEGVVNNTATGVLVNNLLFIILPPAGQFMNSGTFVNNNSFLDLSVENPVIELGEEFTLPPGYSFSIEDFQAFQVLGDLFNKSPSTIDVYGTTYLYNVFENGDISTPGTVNVHTDAAIILLGGTLINKHVGSVINVLTGGKIYNFLGVLDTQVGTINVAQGATIHNARGNDPVADITFASGSNFTDNLEVNLDRNLDIDYTWTITKKVKINGYGNHITFGPNGGIIVQGDITLTLEDVVFNNVSGNKIRCTEDTTTLSMHNVTWNMDGNYSLTKGKAEVTGEWLVKSNEHTFNYETDQVTTIHSNGLWKFDNTTFNYNTEPNKMAMEDELAKLHINHGRVLATTACTLADGKLLISGEGKLHGISTLNLIGLDEIEVFGGVKQIGDVLL